MKQTVREWTTMRLACCATIMLALLTVTGCASRPSPVQSCTLQQEDRDIELGRSVSAEIRKRHPDAKGAEHVKLDENLDKNGNLTVEATYHLLPPPPNDPIFRATFIMQPCTFKILRAKFH